MSVTFLPVWFLKLKEPTCETRKIFFHFKIYFRSWENQILDNQILRCHQMPKLNKKSTYYWIIWEVNTVKAKKIMKKFHKNCNLKTSSKPFCVCKEWGTTSIEKWNFWRKLCIRNYQNLSNPAHRRTLIPFYKRLLKNEKWPETSFQKNFDKTFFGKIWLFQEGKGAFKVKKKQHFFSFQKSSPF